MPGKILVGTASWADPGFVEDWYPRNLPSSERLPYYASHFNFVELNSSFYGLPVARSVEKWCLQTPPDFVFDVKLHKLLSRHVALAENLPPALRAKAHIHAGRIQLTPEIEKAVALQFLEGIRPFKESGKLGALLLQLAPSFAPRVHKLEELEPLLDTLDGYPVAIELRHSGWVSGEQQALTMEFLRRRKVSYVGVDAPESSHFMSMPDLDAVTNPDLGYIRLHGRNVEGFLTGKTVAERFDYQYSDQELKQIAARALNLADRTKRTHVVYNNNKSDYALTAASKFRAIILEERAQMIDPPPVTRNLEQGKLFQM